jgi:hypothetical protein
VDYISESYASERARLERRVLRGEEKGHIVADYRVTPGRFTHYANHPDNSTHSLYASEIIIGFSVINDQSSLHISREKSVRAWNARPSLDKGSNYRDV